MDYPISQLRMVQLVMKGNHGMPTTHMCHESQVDKLVQASIRLHHTHGNPGRMGDLTCSREGEIMIDGHPYLPLRNLWEIRVQRLKVETTSYWWATETLSKNNDPDGAQLNTIDYMQPARVWAHPDLLAAERKAEEDED